VVARILPGIRDVLRAPGPAPADASERPHPTRVLELAPDARLTPYRWEFTDNGRAFSVMVPARVLLTDAALNRRFAIAGLGITLAFREHVRDALGRSELLSVLEKFCAPFPGYYLYYPQRRQASRALSAFIDHLQGWRRASRAVRPRRR